MLFAASERAFVCARCRIAQARTRSGGPVLGRSTGHRASGDQRRNASRSVVEATRYEAQTRRQVEEGVSKRTSKAKAREIASGTCLQGQRRYASGLAVAEESQPTSHEDEPESNIPQEAAENEVYLRVGKKGVHHKRAQLGVPALGKPAEIIIVDEEEGPRRENRRQFSRQEERSVGSPSEERVNASSEEVGRKATPEEVAANIEAFQEAAGEPHSRITRDQWKGLTSKLAQSFTQNQLFHYATTTLPKRPPADSDDGDNPSPKPIRQTPLKVFKGLKKLLIVSIILGRIWGFKIIGQEQAFEKKITVDEARLLLTVPNPELQSILRGRQLRLDVVESDRVVRLSGLSDSFDSAKRKVEALMKTIRTENFRIGNYIDLKGQERTGSDAADLRLAEELAQKYNINVRLKSRPPQKNAAKAWAITSYKEGLLAVQNAVRDLQVAHQPVPSPAHAVVQIVKKDIGNVRFVDSVYDDDAPRTASQANDWARGILPALDKHEESPATPASKIGDDLFPRGYGKMMKHVNDTADSHLHLSAQFAQILFPYRHFGHEIAPPKYSFPTVSPKAQIIRPITPRPTTLARIYAGLLPRLSKLQPKSQSRKIELLLTPTPVEDSLPPKIRLTLSTIPDKQGQTPEATEIHAIFEDDLQDMLLPTMPVDIRFNMQIRHNLFKSEADFATQITDLLFKGPSSSQRGPLANRLSPFIDLSIPNTFMQSIHSRAKASGKSTPAQKSKTKREPAKTAAANDTDTPDNLDIPTDPPNTTPNPSSSNETKVRYILHSTRLIEATQFLLPNTKLPNHKPADLDYKIPLIYSHISDLHSGGQWKTLEILLDGRSRKGEGKPEIDKKGVGRFVKAAVGFAEGFS